MTISSKLLDLFWEEDPGAFRTAVLTTLGLFVCVTYLVGLMTRYSTTSPPKKKYGGDEYRLPPRSSAGLIQTIRSLTSHDCPWFFLRSAKECGFVFRLATYFGRRRAVVAVGDAKVAREILMDPKSTKPSSIYFTSPEPFGSTMFDAEGTRWKHVRKGVTPSFSSNRVRRMQHLCEEHTEVWMETILKPKIEKGEPFDVSFEFKILTLSIILEAAFEYQSDREEIIKFSNDLDLMLRLRGKSCVRPLNRLLGSLSPTVRRFRAALKEVHAFSKKVLDTYRENHNQGRTSGETTVVQSILTNENYASDKERIGDVFIFIAAGHDTTAYSLAWTLLELAKHPEETMKIQKALSAVVKKEERAQCDVLQNAIKEGMRLHPVASVGGARCTSKDIVCAPPKKKDERRIVIPKGSIVFLPQILLNYNPENFENAEEFVPSRWDEPSALAKEAFMPFSLGRRNCVGQSLATAELYSVLAKLLSAPDYEFSVVNEGKTEHFTTLKPTGFLCLVTRKKKTLA